MQQLSTFQIVVLGIFAALTLIGVGVFAASGGFTSGEAVGQVVVWGTEDTYVVQEVITELRINDKAFQEVYYVEKNPATYATELINAMAAGQGPDLFLMPQAELSAFEDKVLAVPYKEISQNIFINSYIDAAQVYLTPGGILALPFTIDPLVMYWNRDMFASAGVANPPQYWNDFLALAPKISQLDGTSAVKKSAVSLGLWSNIGTAKEIISTLFLQAGDRIVTRNESGGLDVVLGESPENNATEPAASALRFYTEFANPSKTTYSWNRSLPSARNMFVAGDLAVYFGYASEQGEIAERNANLRFGIAVMPQIQGNASALTYAKILGLSIPRTSMNPRGALLIAQKLSSPPAALALAARTGLPPVRRDIAIDTSENAAMQTFAASALIAQAWLDPSPKETNKIFQTMIESVVSGQKEPQSAVFTAAEEFNDIIPR